MILSHDRLKTEWEMLKVEGHILLSALNNLSTLEQIAKTDPVWVYKDPGQVKFLNTSLDLLCSELRLHESQ